MALTRLRRGSYMKNDPLAILKSLDVPPTQLRASFGLKPDVAINKM